MFAWLTMIIITLKKSVALQLCVCARLSDNSML